MIGLQSALRWHYDMTHQADVVREYELRMWRWRCEQFRILHALLVDQIDHYTASGAYIEGYLAWPDRDMPLARMPPWRQCQICAAEPEVRTLEADLVWFFPCLLFLPQKLEVEDQQSSAA